MASNLSKGPLLRAISARSYAHLAPVSGTPNYEVKTSVQPNNLVVSAAENEALLTRISVIFRAGSRNENADNLGVTHVLRTAAGLSTKTASQFAIIRNLQQVGASLTATSDRETIAYTLEGTRQAVETALPFLTAVITEQEFRPWEIADITNRLHIDIATRTLQIRGIDLLHNAAFRTGLGNSLFIPKTHIGKISSETLQHYVNSNFLAGRAAVVGLGINHSELVNYAQSLDIQTGEGSVPASPYKGGELRSNKGGKLAYVAIAGEGASLKNQKEALAFAVLQNAIGCGPRVKWSLHDQGVYSKTVGSCGSDYASQAINVSYSDTGLFGIFLATPKESAAQLVEAAVKTLKNGNVTDEDVVKGKNLLKTNLLSENENGSTAIWNLATQAVLTGQAQSSSQIAAAIDSISTSDVRSALKKAGQKISLAAIGNLAGVPYLDELK